MMKRFARWKVPAGLPTSVLALLCVFFFEAPVSAGMTFTKKTTLVSADGVESTLLVQKVYVDGDRVRTEEDASEIEGNPGVRIYDFEKKKAYTVMRNINLYMEDTLSVSKEVILQDRDPQKDKRYTEDKTIRIEKVRLADTVIQGHPAAHYEIKIIQKPEKSKEERVIEDYALWLALDLEEMPLRYEFHYPNKSGKIIEFLDILAEDLKPDLFMLPEGALRVQPF
jgi:hypothetical protein